MAEIVSATARGFITGWNENYCQYTWRGENKERKCISIADVSYKYGVKLL